MSQTLVVMKDHRRNPRIRVAAVGLSVFCALPVFATTISLTELESYYSANARNGIVLNQPFAENCVRNTKKCNSFDISHSSVSGMNGATSMDLQDLFINDVAQWNASTGQSNFLSTKKSIYKNLAYHNSKERYDLPFAQLESWGGLFHPPVKQLTLPLEEYRGPSRKPASIEPGQSFYNANEQAKIDAFSETELTFGNQLKLLKNENSFFAKIDLINRSKNYLFVASMAFACGGRMNQIRDAMIAAKRRGVDVRLFGEVLYGKTIYAPCLKPLKDAGIKIVYSKSSVNLKTFTAIMHHKYWIRDGEEGIIGGQNLLNSEMDSDGFNYSNRDTDVAIKSGPAVQDLEANFIKLWNRYKRKRDSSISSYATANETLKAQQRLNGQRGAKNYSTVLSDPTRRNRGVCRAVFQDPGAKVTSIAKIYQSYVNLTQSSLYFSTPGMGLKTKSQKKDPKLWALSEAIRAKAKAGMTVNVLTNGADGGTSEVTAWLQDMKGKLAQKDLTFFEKLFNKINEFQGGNGAHSNRKGAELFVSGLEDKMQTWAYFRYSHQKVWLFDDTLVGVGSFNFDKNSAELNHEETMLCLDDSLANEMVEASTQDLVNAVPIR